MSYSADLDPILSVPANDGQDTSTSCLYTRLGSVINLESIELTNSLAAGNGITVDGSRVWVNGSGTTYLDSMQNGFVSTGGGDLSITAPTLNKGSQPTGYAIVIQEGSRGMIKANGASVLDGTTNSTLTGGTPNAYPGVPITWTVGADVLAVID